MLVTLVSVVAAQTVSWRAPEAVNTGEERTFVVPVRPGAAYVLRVRTGCVREPKWQLRGGRWVDTRRNERLFGADFRATVDGAPHILEVGDRTPAWTSVPFTARTATVTLRVWDAWPRDPPWHCAADLIEVLEAC